MRAQTATNKLAATTIAIWLAISTARFLGLATWVADDDIWSYLFLKAKGDGRFRLGAPVRPDDSQPSSNVPALEYMRTRRPKPRPRMLQRRSETTRSSARCLRIPKRDRKEVR